jgi:hypothetical protein
MSNICKVNGRTFTDLTLHQLTVTSVEFEGDWKELTRYVANVKLELSSADGISRQ